MVGRVSGVGLECPKGSNIGNHNRGAGQQNIAGEPVLPLLLWYGIWLCAVLRRQFQVSNSRHMIARRRRCFLAIYSWNPRRLDTVKVCDPRPICTRGKSLCQEPKYGFQGF